MSSRQTKKQKKASKTKAPQTVQFGLTRSEQLELENLTLKKRLLFAQANELDIRFEGVKAVIQKRLAIVDAVSMTFSKDFTRGTALVEKGGSS